MSNRVVVTAVGTFLWISIGVRLEAQLPLGYALGFRGLPSEVEAAPGGVQTITAFAAMTTGESLENSEGEPSGAQAVASFSDEELGRIGRLDAESTSSTGCQDA